MNLFGKNYSGDKLKSAAPQKIKDFGIAQILKLFKYIGHPITNQNHINSFASAWQYNFYPRSSKLIEKGKMNSTIYFIVSGSTILYEQEIPEKDIFLVLNDGNFALTLNSFQRNSPANFNLEAATNTHVLEMSKDSFNHYILSPYGPHLKSVIETLIGYYEKYFHEINMIMRKKSNEKVEELFLKNPEIFDNVSHKFLAAMLNIKPETFSRSIQNLKKKVENQYLQKHTS